MTHISLWLYSKLKCKTVFEFLFERGIVVSYDRMRRLIDQIVAQDLVYFDSVGAIVPWNLKRELLTIAAVDNVDKSARNTTGGSFHGTSISLFQIEYPSTCVVILLL